MAVATTLSGTRLVVDPGQEKIVELLVRNTGDVVDQYHVTVLGRVDRWVKAIPETVNLMPGTEQTVQLVFDLPKSFEARAGEFPIAIKVASREDPKSTIIDEATVEVTPFIAVSARLDPPKRRGSRSATYRLVVESRGNDHTHLVVNGYHADEGDQLDVKLAFPEFVAEPGTETTVKLRAVPRKRFLKGQPQTLPFVIHIGGEKVEDPVLVDGVMIQNPILAAWLLRVLVAAAAVITALVIWVLFFAPKPTSVATTSAAAKDKGGQQIADAAPGAPAAAAAAPASAAPTSAPPAAAAAAAAPAQPLQPSPAAAATAAPATAAAAAAAAPAASMSPAQAAAVSAATTPAATQAATPAATTTAAAPTSTAPAAPDLTTGIPVLLDLPSARSYQAVKLTAPVGTKQVYRIAMKSGDTEAYGPTKDAATSTVDPAASSATAAGGPTAPSVPGQAGTLSPFSASGSPLAVSTFAVDGTSSLQPSVVTLSATSPSGVLAVVLDCTASNASGNLCTFAPTFIVEPPKTTSTVSGASTVPSAATASTGR